MPRRTDGQGARERLLAAATAVFADRGYRAPLRDLTRAARCNIAAVNYYFGHKETLYREVVNGLLAELRQQRLAAIERALASPEPTIEHLLGEFAAAFVAPFAHPERGRLHWQLIHHELMAPRLPHGQLQATIEPVVTALAFALQRLCPSLDDGARSGAEAVVAQLHYVVHPERELLAEAVPTDARLQQAVRFALAGLRGLAAQGC